MRYVTATIGAVFIFVACSVVGFLLTAFEPFQGVVTLPLGVVTITGNPVFLVGIVVGIPAAVHSFRSTLKREANKAEEWSRAIQFKLPD